MDELIVLYIGAGAFALYVIVLTVWGGFKTDITHLTYTLEEKLGRKWMIITPITYFITASSFVYVALSLPDKYQKIALLICAGALFFLVGIFYDVRKNNKLKNTLHVGGAILAIISGLVFSLLSKGWFSGIAFLTAYLLIKNGLWKIKHTTYWVEAWAVIMIMFSGWLTIRKKRK